MKKLTVFFIISLCIVKVSWNAFADRYVHKSLERFEYADLREAIPVQTYPTHVGENHENDFKYYYKIIEEIQNAYLHGNGVVYGLEVTHSDLSTVTISTGVAIDRQGRLISLAKDGFYCEKSDENEIADTDFKESDRILSNKINYNINKKGKLYLTIRYAYKKKPEKPGNSYKEMPKIIQVPCIQLQTEEEIKENDKEKCVILAIIETNAKSEIMKLKYWDEEKKIGRRYANVVRFDNHSNLVIGHETLASNKSGDFNTAIGVKALQLNTVGSNNIALGHETLASNKSGDFNTAIGAYTLHLNTKGSGNTANGFESLLNNTTGEYNTAIGGSSLKGNIGGKSNTAVGWASLHYNTDGIENTAVGVDALNSNKEGKKNVAVGKDALRNNERGEKNVAIGHSAGGSTNGSGNVFIGNEAGSGEKNCSNKLYIDNDGTSPLVYGDFSKNYVAINKTIPKPDIEGLDVNGQIRVNGKIRHNGTIKGSDKRWKKDIKPLKNSLNNILRLQGVNFYWKVDEYPDNGFTGEKQIGLIAQDVEKVIPELVHTDSKGYKSLSYEMLTAVLIEAVKEQQKQIEQLKSDNSQLRQRVAAIESRFNDLQSMLTTYTHYRSEQNKRIE